MRRNRIVVSYSGIRTFGTVGAVNCSGLRTGVTGVVRSTASLTGPGMRSDTGFGVDTRFDRGSAWVTVVVVICWYCNWFPDPTWIVSLVVVI